MPTEYAHSNLHIGSLITWRSSHQRTTVQIKVLFDNGARQPLGCGTLPAHPLNGAVARWQSNIHLRINNWLAN